MKTYTTTTEKPRLVIEQDTYTSSPRSQDNLGYFITVESRRDSPDQHETLEDIVKTTGDEAIDQIDHIERIKKGIKKEMGEKVLAIYPIVKYEHSGVVYKLGTVHGFDYSNCGFYIITDKHAKFLGSKKDIEAIIKAELSEYNAWVNGEVYMYTLYDEKGKEVDTCGGFYGTEYIKDHLPKEWQNENLFEYIQ